MAKNMISPNDIDIMIKKNRDMANEMCRLSEQQQEFFHRYYMFLCDNGSKLNMPIHEEIENSFYDLIKQIMQNTHAIEELNYRANQYTNVLQSILDFMRFEIKQFEDFE